MWGSFVNKLLNEKGIQKPRKGADCGDHPPITPMRVASEAELGGDTWRIYSYITRHFIATVYLYFSRFLILILYTNYKMQLMILRKQSIITFFAQNRQKK